MTTRFVSDKTTTMYKNATRSSRHGYLIFGDEVKTTGPATHGRVPLEFRGRPGFVKESRLEATHPLEFYSVDVGQGDATFIVTPAGKKILIDGGLNRRALGFLVWRYRLDNPANSVVIDLMVLTHADGDHLRGLTPILKHPQINVKKIIHNGIATFDDNSLYETQLGDLDASKGFLITRHDNLSDLNALSNISNNFRDWKTAVAAEGANYQAVDANMKTIDVGDPEVTLEILGPKRETDGSYKWFGNKSHTINGHSVVLRLTFDDVSFMLSGDLNIEGAEHLLADPVLASKMSAHVLKCPHHGSHEFHHSFLEEVRPQISTISSGDAPDHGHPRANFIAAIGLASRSKSPLVFSTEIAATFVGDGETAAPADGTAIDGLDFTTTTGNDMVRKRFKLLLPGIINVRTNGKELYAFRRVNAGYQWESYGPLEPAPKPSIFC
jgi:competence protein ComEC